MPTKIGINGFGRIGRLDLRAAFGSKELEFVHINEPHASAQAAAHLLEFDTVHGRWDHEITTDEQSDRPSAIHQRTPQAPLIGLKKE
jgi:glyceraldehyde 3-phosphate dehydrogenase